MNCHRTGRPHPERVGCGGGGGTEFWGEDPGEMDGERGYLQGYSWILGAGRR